MENVPHDMLNAADSNIVSSMKHSNLKTKNYKVINNDVVVV